MSLLDKLFKTPISEINVIKGTPSTTLEQYITTINPKGLKDVCSECCTSLNLAFEQFYKSIFSASSSIKIKQEEIVYNSNDDLCIQLLPQFQNKKITNILIEKFDETIVIKDGKEIISNELNFVELLKTSKETIFQTILQRCNNSMCQWGIVVMTYIKKEMRYNDFHVMNYIKVGDSPLIIIDATINKVYYNVSEFPNSYYSIMCYLPINSYQLPISIATIKKESIEEEEEEEEEDIQIVKKTVTKKDKKYKCYWDGCNKFFKTAINLKIHTRTHTGEKPHVCVWHGCDYRASQAHHLKRHTKKHNIN